MYQYKGSTDTIVAIATPSGMGGIGIVRLSGPQALAIADRLFIARNKTKPSQFRNFVVHYGYAVKETRDPQETEVIDEALLTIMRSPRSYTREDVVEISCHGGMVVLKAILTRAMELGGRLAEPGEFTKRAFLNGRIDLAQAEAVLDIIQSKTEASLKISTHQLRGELSLELESIRERLMNIYIRLEASVNFPEDDVEAQNRPEIRETIVEAGRCVESLLESGEQGRILREGIKIVLCGKPNVGKSSLLNVLLKQPRAIVSEIAGTTRDTIEETAQIQGIPLQLVDTAGILEPRDLIEEEAVRRSRISIQSADLVLLLLDAGQGVTAADEDLFAQAKDQTVLIVINKCDLNRPDLQQIQRLFPGKTIIEISALKKTGIKDLEKAMLDHVWQGKPADPQRILINNMRHIQSLKNGRLAIKEGLRALDDGLSLEFVSEGIKRGINSLDDITGRNVDIDLVDQIFSSFCIGK